MQNYSALDTISELVPYVGTNDMSTTKQGDTRISLVMGESKYR